MTRPFEFPPTAGVPVVAVAIHAGHALRPEVRRRMSLDEATRLREEDPATEVIAAGAGAPVVVNRSRFEVDLNRPRDGAVYRTAEQCWGLEVWSNPLPDEVVDRSLALHDEFYRTLTDRLDRLAARGPFVVLDVHSYNHRRRGPGAPEDPAPENPDVNVGTGSMDRARWSPVVDALTDSMRAATIGEEALDVRENVRFEGGHLPRWVHERYQGAGCAIALEFKKTFMDEWTGMLDGSHLVALARSLGDGVPPVLDALDRVPA